MIFQFIAAKLGPRWILHVLPYVVMAIVGWGIYHKVFLSPTTTVQDGGSITNVYGSDVKRVPVGGCATYRLNTDIFWKSK